LWIGDSKRNAKIRNKEKRDKNENEVTCAMYQSSRSWYAFDQDVILFQEHLLSQGHVHLDFRFVESYAMTLK